jgi:hypothetical protein
MMPPLATMIYAGALGLVLVFLSGRVIGRRRDRQVGIGDGGDAELARRVRAHANFTEYVPLALILMLLIEIAGIGAWLVHGLGVSLVAGRLVHAWSMTASSITARTVGMSLTLMVVGVAAAVCLVFGVGGFAR